MVKYLLLCGILVLETPEVGIGIAGTGLGSLVTIKAHWGRSKLTGDDQGSLLTQWLRSRLTGDGQGSLVTVKAHW